MSTAVLPDEQDFYRFCLANPTLRVECSADGNVVVLPPIGGDIGCMEAEFIAELGIWNRHVQLGVVFSSSTMFRLPSDGYRSPTVAWVELSRWNALTLEEQVKFPPLAPDFLIELRSRTDSLKVLRDKMQEYMDSGVRLGWMFNPQTQEAEIYRLGQDKEIVALPTLLKGETVLPGFELKISKFA